MFAIWSWERSHRKPSSIGGPKERREKTTMAQTRYMTLLRKALLGFNIEPDPVLAMLQWIAQRIGWSP